MKIVEAALADRVCLLPPIAGITSLMRPDATGPDAGTPRATAGKPRLPTLKWFRVLLQRTREDAAAAPTVQWAGWPIFVGSISARNSSRNVETERREIPRSKAMTLDEPIHARRRKLIEKRRGILRGA